MPHEKSWNRKEECVGSVKMLWSFQSPIFFDSRNRMQHFLPILKYERQLLSKNRIGSQQMAETIMHWVLVEETMRKRKKKTPQNVEFKKFKKMKWKIRFFSVRGFPLSGGFSRFFLSVNTVQRALLTSFCGKSISSDGFFYFHFSFEFVVVFFLGILIFFFCLSSKLLIESRLPAWVSHFIGNVRGFGLNPF